MVSATCPSDFNNPLNSEDDVSLEYPVFSWENVPLYVHVGVSKGLQEGQIEYLAKHYDFIGLTGGVMDRDYRRNNDLTGEDIIAETTRKIKRFNPKAKVLFYWAADQKKPHFKRSNQALAATGFDCDSPSMIRYLRKKNVYAEVFDLTQKHVRDWWSDRAAEAIHKYGCDGIFSDGVTCFRQGGPMERFLGEEKRVSLDEGMMQALRDAKAKMGPSSINIFNPLHGHEDGQRPLGEEYLPVTDGAMVDDFDRAANIIEKRQSKEYIVNTIKTMTRAAKRGKIVVFKAWPAFTWWSDKKMMERPQEEIVQVAKENILFPLASFLIGAERYCYFCYSWGWLLEHGALERFPELYKPLGEPRDDAVQVGWTFRREFQHAWVFLDVEQRYGQIDWKDDGP